MNSVAEASSGSHYNEPVHKEETPLHRRARKSITHPSCSENALYHFQSFAENASIDGIKFLGEKRRTIPERVFWSVTLTIALILCLFLVTKTYQKWINNPVIISFATKEISISEIPFPSITICPETKAVKDMFNYTDIFLKLSAKENVTENEKVQFEYLSLICDTGSELLDKRDITTNKGVIDYLMKVAPDWNPRVLDIQWRGDNQVNSSALFSPILTSEGICYTFNMLDRKELFTDLTFYNEVLFSTNGLSSKWSPETGYTSDADIDAYPRRTTNAGAKGGIKFHLFILKDDIEYACGDGSQGFKVALHNPTEVPRLRQSYFQLPLDQSVVASIKPYMMTTSEDLRSYSADDRKCYFAAEKKLKFFKIYNQQNCLIECLTNFTLLHCGCVNFHMPNLHFLGEESTPICGALSVNCMEYANSWFLENDTNQKLKKLKNTKTSTDKCDCLPACDSLQYEIETSQSNWNWKEAFKVYRRSKEWKKFLEGVDEDRLHVVQLTVFFKDMQFLTLERNEWKGYTDFWSDVGGIIGLFTGFSFITMFEVFYYLSLRPTCNVKMFGRRFWSGAPELLEKGR